MFQTTLDDHQQDDLWTCIRALRYTGLKLEPYTRSKLEEIHQRIYRKLAHLPRCDKECSLKALSSWCETCLGWKDELSKIVKKSNKGIRWTFFKSWKWPDSYENIAPIFLSSGKEGLAKNELNLSDLSAACTIWMNCKEMNVQDFFVKKVLEVRNATFHNLQVTHVEKAKVFDALQDLIKDPEFKAVINKDMCLTELGEIKKGSKTFIVKLEKLISQRRSEDKVILDIAAVVNDISVSVKDISNKLDSQNGTDRLVHGIERIEHGLNSFYRMVVVAYSILLITLCIQPSTKPPSEITTRTNKQGCISEDYIYPFRQDLPLLAYLKHHSDLVGRGWLINNIEDSLLTNLSSRGIVISAEFGFGKSAIVSHILCAVKNQIGYRLREHVVAFHVCKFDVPSTKSPERFIHRLVGFFSTKSAEYGNIISMLSEDLILYNKENCWKEIEACFDQAVTFPFKEMKTNGDIWLIVIDALDECYYSIEKKNVLLDLLSSRLQHFPKWVKFLITTRQFGRLSELRKLQHMSMSSNDPNNLDDIKSYVRKNYEKNMKIFSDTSIEMMINKSQGNFLYVLHALPHILELNKTEIDLPDIPETLKDVYELNFDREFSKGKSFAVCKMILEIMCTTLHPLTKIEIFQILADNPGVDNSSVLFETEFMRLSFFINSGDRVNFKHRAIYSWLLNEQNEVYEISTKTGHDLISKFILSNLKFNKTGNIVELVIHLAETGNEELLKMYELINIADTLSFKASSVLHDLIEISSSAYALGLLLQKHNNIDILGKDSITPAYHAASNGHLEQLKLLHRKGADMNVVVPGCKCLLIDTNEIGEEEMKTRSNIGFTVLHIAVDKNFLNVVNFLIDETDISLYNTDSTGMRAIDIACEKGYLNIVKRIHVRDKHILDEQCLYLATNNRQINIVNYAISSGFDISCITRKRAELELKNLTGTCKCNDSGSHWKSELLNRLWIVRQETILHIAIRLGFDDLAEILVHNQKRSLNCSDAFGYIPQLLAIKYNRANLLPKLLEYELGVCSKLGTHIRKIDNQKIIRLQLQEEPCPEGANVAHLMTIYKRTNLMEMLNLFAFKWNTRDLMGNLPVHYAACHSTAFVTFFKHRFGRRIFLERTRNGSSVYHLAALCLNDESLREMTNDFSENLTDFALNTVIDKNKRNIIHYSVLSYVPPFLSEGSNVTTYKFYKITKYFSQFINVTAEDIFGNNVFHYILKNGNMIAYLSLNYTMTPSDLKRAVLETINKNGLSAAEYVLKHSMPGTFFVTNESLTNLLNLRMTDYEHINEYLWEQCLTNLLLGCLTPGELVDFADRYIDVVILKCPYLTRFIFITFQKNNITLLNQNKFRNLIVRGMKLSKVGSKYAFPWISLYSISTIYGSILQVCGSPLYLSPLHYIVLNSLSYNLSAADFNTVNIALEKTKDSETFTCFTAEGYNLLHYAIIGGNIDLAVRLQNEGVMVMTENVSASDMMYMLNFVRFKPGLNQKSKIDNFLANFIAHNENRLKVDDFCTNRSQSLSLIHILAINGMIKAMDEVAKIFGNEILRCVNVDGFSCRYFVVLFQRTDLENYFITKDITYGIPNRISEELLLINMKNKFSLTRYNSPISRLVASPAPVHMIDTRLLMKTYSYLTALFRSQYMSFRSNDLFRSNLIYFRQGLYLYRKLFLRTHVLTINVKKILPGGHPNHWVNSNLLKSVHNDLQNLRHWSEIRHISLSWTREYPFLDNINRILQRPKMNNYLNPDVHDTCDTNSVWHMLFYLEKVFKVFTTNIQNIIVLMNLLDQKALIKAGDSPITFLGYEDGCSRFPSLLTTGTVYAIRRLRYLNQIKSTLAYKEILSRMDYLKPQEESDDDLEKERAFMNDMINNTKKRVRWIATNFKCEVLPFLSLQSENSWIKAKCEDL